MKKVFLVVSCLLLVVGLSNGCGEMRLPYNYNSTVDAEFTYFPVDLAKLFWADNPDYQAEYLINLNTNGPFLSPFAIHTEGDHNDGYGKWYLRSWDRSLKVYMPVQGTILPKNITNTLNRVTTYEGDEVCVDTTVDFVINEHVTLRFGHLELLKSIQDDLDNSEDGYLTLPAGTHVGYILSLAYSGEATTGSLDFQVSDDRVNQGVAYDPEYHANQWSLPLNYFTSDLQTEIETYYDILYSRLAEIGRSPESKLDSALNIHIGNSPWGVWYYEEGDLVTAEGHYDWGMSVITMLKHPEKTNEETFIYDLSISTMEVPVRSDLVGLFNANNAETAPDKYTFLESAVWSLYLESGTTNEAGVFRMEAPLGTHYMKFEFLEESCSVCPWDDKLRIEFFETSAEASGAFVDPLIYGRNPSE
ncbi:MAG: hypothetical protein ABIE84_02290 [bacterium]